MSHRTCTCPTSERWCSIPDWEGFYEVSDHGQVRSIDRTVVDRNGRLLRYRGVVLAQAVHTRGYWSVHLSQPGRKRLALVHQLVLEAFVGPRPPAAEARHWDGDYGHNHLSNLLWGTSSENNCDIVRHGRHWQTLKATCPLGHLLVAPNLVASRARIGHRGCLACDRASSKVSSYRRRYGIMIDLKAEADLRYRKIMQGVSA